MGKNYMQEVAKMLDVELGEEFKIKGIDGTYRMTCEGLFDGYHSKRPALLCLIVGELEIEKIPWKPKNGKKCWCIGSGYEVFSNKWDETSHIDLVRYKLGNCFRTKEEITQEVIERYKAFLNNGERIEW